MNAFKELINVWCNAKSNGNFIFPCLVIVDSVYKVSWSWETNGSLPSFWLRLMHTSELMCQAHATHHGKGFPSKWRVISSEIEWRFIQFNWFSLYLTLPCSQWKWKYVSLWLTLFQVINQQLEETKWRETKNNLSMKMASRVWPLRIY